MLQHDVGIGALTLSGILTVGTRDILIVFLCEFLAQCSRVDALLTDVETYCGLTQSPSHVGIQSTTINIEVVIVLACCSSSLSTNQLIVILEFVIIELRRNLPGLLLVVQTQVERSHTVVCLLILVVVFGTVESVGTVALGRDTHLSIDVETLVVAQVNLSETLSFLEVAVVCSSVRTLVASAGRVGVCPLAFGISRLHTSLCSETSKASAFYTCRYSIILCLLGHDIDGTIEG